MTYPPSDAECQRLFEELKRLDTTSSHEFNTRKYEIIHDLAEARYYEAKPYFIAGLDGPDPDYRVACIDALVTHWRDAEPTIVSKLLYMAESDPAETVRWEAVVALGKLGAHEALPVLKRIAQNRKARLDIRQAAYESFVAIETPPEDFLELALQAERRQLFEELKQLDAMRGDELNARKYELIFQLASINTFEAEPYLIEGLDHSNPEYRWACITALAFGLRSTDPRFVSKLLDLAQHDPEERVKDAAVRALDAAVRAFGELRLEEALPLLRQIVEYHNKYPQLWRKAYLALLQILDRPREEINALHGNFDHAAINQDLLRVIPNHLDRPPAD